MAEGTSNYAESLGFRDWAINTEEMKAFLGVWFSLPLSKTSRLRDSWSRNPSFCNIKAQTVFGRDRFLSILRFLHWPSTGVAGTDSLYKLRSLIGSLQGNFKKYYGPNGYYSVDESMIGFRGRVKFLQYIPSKKRKFGMKCFCLAEASTGYTVNFEIYTGKDEWPSADLAYNVSMSLLESLQNSFCSVTFDNWFTSYNLMTDLLALDIYATGTYRANRRLFPSDLPAYGKDTPRGTSSLRQRDGVTAGVWKDAKPVHIASTFCSTQKSFVSRKTPTDRQAQIPCPSAISFYNQTMFGVDLSDQLRESYSITRKSTKYWKYIFWYLLETTLVNGFVIWKKNLVAKHLFKDSQHSHCNFRLLVSRALIDNHTYRKRGAAVFSNIRGKDHFLEKIAPSVSKRGKLSCRTCCRLAKRTAGGRAIATTFRCGTCKIPLCKGQCFEQHAQ